MRIRMVSCHFRFNCVVNGENNGEAELFQVKGKEEGKNAAKGIIKKAVTHWRTSVM